MNEDTFAKWTLGIDAGFCLVGGLVLMLGGVFMADAVGVSGWWISIAGIVVTFWTLVVALAGSRKHVTRRELERIIGGNAAAVVLLIVLMVIPGVFTSGGRIAAAVVAAIIAGFAAVQSFARSRLLKVGFFGLSTDDPDWSPAAANADG